MSVWNKVYAKINWQNKPLRTTPLGRSKLQIQDDALDIIDDRVIELNNNKIDRETGKGLSTNDYTDAEKNKLSDIEVGAQVNTVTSVAGKTGAVELTKSDVGLGNVDNTSDADKPISTLQQIALDTRVDKWTLISTAVDLNTITTSGFYKIPNGCTNKPSMGGGGEATLIVVSHPYGRGNTILQVLFNQFQYTPQVFYRTGSNTKTTPTFNAWQTIADTNVITTMVSVLANQGLSDEEKSNARANIGAGTSNFSGSYNDLVDKPIYLTGSLSVGQTVISFTDNKISNNSVIDVYTDVYGINVNNMSVNDNTLTLTFDAQSTDINIKVKIS